MTNQFNNNFIKLWRKAQDLPNFKEIKKKLLRLHYQREDFRLAKSKAGIKMKPILHRKMCNLWMQMRRLCRTKQEIEYFKSYHSAFNKSPKQKAKNNYYNSKRQHKYKSKEEKEYIRKALEIWVKKNRKECGLKYMSDCLRIPQNQITKEVHEQWQSNLRLKRELKKQKHENTSPTTKNHP